MKRGFGIKNIKKQFGTTEKINGELVSACQYLETSETDFINNAIYEAGEYVNFAKECEEKLKNDNQIVLYSESVYLGAALNIGDQWHQTIITITKLNQENYEYGINISNDFWGDNGYQNKQSFINEFFTDDLYEFLETFTKRYSLKINKKIYNQFLGF